MLSSCANLNLDDISLSPVSDLTPTVMSFVASKSDTVQLARLRRGLLACFAKRGVKR